MRSAVSIINAVSAAPRHYDVSELKEEGFVDEREAETAGRLSSALTALGPGLLIHGVGHWRMGDERGGWRLLGLEGAGLAALTLTSLTHLFWRPNSVGGRMGLETLSHLGWGLFLTSWSADVIGAYQGGLSFALTPQKSRTKTLSVGYRYLSQPLSELPHHLVLSFERLGRRGLLRAHLDVESRAQIVGLELDAGVYLLGGPSAQRPSLSVHLKGRRWRWSASNTTQLALTPYLSWATPLSSLARGLAHTRLFQRVGVGWEGYQSPSVYALSMGQDPQSGSFFERLMSPKSHERATLLLETGMALTLFKETELQASYLQDPTHDVARAQWASSIWGAEALGLNLNTGAWRALITLRQRYDLDFLIEVLVGERWSSWLTVRYALN